MLGLNVGNPTSMHYFQTMFLHPFFEGDVIYRGVNESEQLNPFMKGPSTSPLVKGTCDGLSWLHSM